MKMDDEDKDEDEEEEGGLLEGTCRRGEEIDQKGWRWGRSPDPGWPLHQCDRTGDQGNNSSKFTTGLSPTL